MMKHLRVNSLCFLALAAVANSQNTVGPGDLRVSDSVMTFFVNDTSTGTAFYRVVAENGSGKAVVYPGSGSGAPLGICLYNCGTSGNSAVAVGGRAACSFDSVTTDGDYVTVTVTGQCHDAGPSPPNAQVIGIVLSTQSSPGVYVVLLRPGISSGGTPGGVPSDFQCNVAGVFGPCNIKQNADGSMNASKAITFAVPSTPTFNAGGTTTCDWTASNACQVSMTGNTTLAFSGGHAGGWYRLISVQDATGGRSYTAVPATLSGFSQPDIGGNMVTYQDMQMRGTAFEATPAWCPTCNPGITVPQGLPPNFLPNSFTLFGPTVIGTAYGWKVPAGAATGLMRGDNSGGTVTISQAELGGDVSTSGSNAVTVLKIPPGVTLSGTPTVGKVPTATSGTTATWQTPGGANSTDLTVLDKNIFFGEIGNYSPGNTAGWNISGTCGGGGTLNGGKAGEVVGGTSTAYQQTNATCFVFWPGGAPNTNPIKDFISGGTPLPWTLAGRFQRQNDNADLYFGLSQSQANADNGVFVRYNHSNLHWECVIRSAASDVGTPINFGVTPDTNLHSLKIVGAINSVTCSYDATTGAAMNGTIPAGDVFFIGGNLAGTGTDAFVIVQMALHITGRAL